jgi:quercetin dioxygenase-like cupin family protein
MRHRGPAPSRSDIEAQLGAEGLSPHTWGNEAGATYGRHMHEFHKVLVCVSGTIIFHIQAGDVELGPGDRMELPPGVKHAATVGDSGVECVEAPRR